LSLDRVGLQFEKACLSTRAKKISTNSRDRTLRLCLLKTPCRAKFLPKQESEGTESRKFAGSEGMQDFSRAEPWRMAVPSATREPCRGALLPRRIRPSTVFGLRASGSGDGPPTYGQPRFVLVSAAALRATPARPWWRKMRSGFVIVCREQLNLISW
jgi:hypothetical protein